MGQLKARDYLMIVWEFGIFDDGKKISSDLYIWVFIFYIF